MADTKTLSTRGLQKETADVCADFISVLRKLIEFVQARFTPEVQRHSQLSAARRHMDIAPTLVVEHVGNALFDYAREISAGDFRFIMEFEERPDRYELVNLVLREVKRVYPMVAKSEPDFLRSLRERFCKLIQLYARFLELSAEDLTRKT